MMRNKKLSASINIFPIYFIVALLLIGSVYTVYVINIFKWQNSPDFGWRTMYDSGPNIVAEVFETGETAGLRVGDTIKAINGKPYNTFDELYFRIRNDKIGSVNTYTIERNGKFLDISITTGRLGFQTVFQRSGYIFLLGLSYIIMGILVFLMKPKASESLLFFGMTCFMGMEISFGAPSDLIRPLWFYDIRLFKEVFFPAPMIHLSMRFPRTRTFIRKNPWLLIMPYLFSLTLFVLYKIFAPAYWDAPPVLETINYIYYLSGILVFLLGMVWNIFKEKSAVIRLQSQMIFLGMIIGILIPASELVLRFFWNIYLFPNPSVSFAFFLIIFPLSIGYTIVKHDLFAIDTIVRRTYGYILSTGTIVGVYSLIITVLNIVFQTSEVARSPLFSIIFALAVVFFFKPIHERIQGFVDRIFYRQHYDYRKTIKDVSEAMISIFDPKQIQRMLIGSVVKEMFLENGLLLLPDKSKHAYHIQIAEGNDMKNFVSGELSESDALLRFMQEKNDPIFRYDLDLNPLYENNRETLQHTFETFTSELMLPLKYKDELRGILSLGRKKSGKIYTSEDIDLLKTIINQSAIALENAKLFEENIEKSRMEEELKIAHDIQISMLPEKAPSIEGFAIAAQSIPAREVGGDFYDFIEIGENGAAKKIGIVVGDVSGKAVSGALVMAASRSIFRVLAEFQTSVRDVMSVGNLRLKQDIKKGMFVALVYAVLEPQQKTMTLANAGQTQPILCRSGQSEPAYIDTTGDRFPLGIIKDCDYQETQMLLRQGDTLVFYTDGIVEAVNDKKELYGFDRFMTSIKEAKGLEANLLMSKLTDDVMNFVGNVEQHDDITLVVLKVE
jgi:serine phosphatase RsbU (regulator of sigma subunit)